MIVVVTGRSRLNSAYMEETLEKFEGRIRQMRLVNPLERLAVAAVGSVLADAGTDFPVGDSGIGMYIGMDDAMEDIKDEYFKGIVADGIMGASPLLFPFTSPNAFAAQVSIAFDLRGEGILMPVNRSWDNVIKYATECVAGGYAKMAIAGAITINNRNLSIEAGRYTAEFSLIEGEGDAVRRKARIYHSLMAGDCEGI